MERLILLGVEVNALSQEQLHQLIAQAVARQEHWIIGNHNLHSIYLYHYDIKMRNFFQQCKAAHIDGMPLIYWGRFLGAPLNATHRVTYVDWVRPLMREAQQRGWRVFYLGGKPDIAERASHILRAENPALALEVHHGYFDPGGEENENVLRQINAYAPHILMVGMGMPRQEHWILDNFKQISANVVLNSGACFDYVAGAIPTPPRWMGQKGLEWLYRLIAEPKRLWRRYLIEPFFLFPWVISDLKKKWSLLRTKDHRSRG